MTNNNKTRPLILMVDDVPANIRILAEIFSADYDVQIATDGQSALDLIHRGSQPDLILLDIMMPDINGYDVCRLLKNNPETQDIPVIFITAMSDEEAEELGFSLGAADFITKPFSPSIVKARVRAQLSVWGLIEKLEKLNHQLKEQLVAVTRRQDTAVDQEPFASRQQLFAKVLENTNDGVIITSADGEIIAANRAFTRITGYAETEAIGRNPRFLKSGRHDEMFYRTMWQSIIQEGYWSGEIWNKRKTGEIYPELRTISAVREGGKNTISYYVSVSSDISHVRQVQERMEFLTYHDALTLLPNRNLFIDRLTQAINAGLDEQTLGAVLIFDLDRFREINVARGVDFGDEILRKLASQLLSQIDASLTLSRISGDQFAVLLPCSHPDREITARSALMVVDQVRGTITQISDEVEEDLFHLSGTLGLAIFPDSRTDTAEDVIRRAEAARHRAKQSGGGHTMFFESSTDMNIEHRFKLEQALRVGIRENQLRLYIQSQVDVHDRVVSAEALVRWEHPEEGLISPATFIPLAEKSDLISEIDQWVLSQVCSLNHHMSKHHRPLPISVNISPRHFHQQDFVLELKNLLQLHQSPPGSLVLEITEGMMIQDSEEVVEKMAQISNLGVMLSIDDFGTGYSNLAYLKRLPIHELKIDKSFIRDITSNDNDSVLVDAILSIAERFGLRVVAEGVETLEQRNFLRDRGDVVFQGYLYAPPVPVETWLESEPWRAAISIPAEQTT